MTRLLRVAAVVVLVGGTAAALSSCTGSTPEADPSPTAVVTSSSAEPSATVSPTPTVLPPLTDEEVLALIPSASRTESFAGASEFAEFYVQLYPGLFVVNPDRRLFEALSREGCVFCESAIDGSLATEEAGAYSEGGVFTFEPGLGSGGLSDDGFTYVSRRFSVTDTDTYLSDGTFHRTVAGGTGTVALKLAYEEGAWRVYGAEFAYDDE